MFFEIGCLELPIWSPHGQEATFSGSTGRCVFLPDRETCLLVPTRRHCLLGKQEDTSSCSPRRHVLLLAKKTCLLAQQENMSSIGQEDMSSCSTGAVPEVTSSGSLSSQIIQTLFCYMCIYRYSHTNSVR